MPDDLNVRWSQRLSVILVFLLAFALSSGRGGIALGCTAAVAAINWRFYRFLWRRRGVLFMLSAVPLHFLFHFYSGLAFVVGTILHFVGLLKPSASEIPGEEPS
jgi:O-antigen ligase